MLIGDLAIEAIGYPMTSLEISGPAKLIQVFYFIGADETQSFGPIIYGGIVAVAGATLGGISLAVLKTAGDFEMLEAKLATVQGSVVTASETFERAQQFAAKTPFDVKGVVEASVQLEVYGQRSR
ncbi:hypothetical protein HYS82_01250, partial [Candidatus Amesbacteria bacterium]|nr:hypothetical protein [Candidatus Amesbacteria bacterium]